MSKLKYITAVFTIFVGLFFCSNNVFADKYGDSAFGVNASGGFPANVGGGITFKVAKLPIMFGVSVNKPYREGSFLDVTATSDWHFFSTRFANPFAFYFGAGLYYGFDIKDNKENFDFTLGFRLPLGFSVIIANFEIYTEVAPALRLLEVSGGRSHLFGEDLFLVQGQLGVRFWF